MVVLSRRFVRVYGTSLLVSLQLLLLFLLFLACVAGVFLLNFLLSEQSSVEAVRAIGHVNMLVLSILLFPVSRTSPVLALLRIDVLSAVTMHKLLARCFVLFVLSHGVSMSVFWGLGRLGSRFLQENVVAVSTALAAAFCVVLVASMSWFRIVRVKSFELFYLVHHFFVAVIILSSVHSMYMMDAGSNLRQDLIIYYLIVPAG
jgi:hypothetical protein